MVPTNGLRMRNRVRERRQELGMTLVDLANASDVSRRVVGLIDRQDDHVPSGTVMLKLATALNAPIEELFYSDAAEPTEAVA